MVVSMQREAGDAKPGHRGQCHSIQAIEVPERVGLRMLFARINADVVEIVEVIEGAYADPAFAEGLVDGGHDW